MTDSRFPYTKGSIFLAESPSLVSKEVDMRAVVVLHDNAQADTLLVAGISSKSSHLDSEFTVPIPSSTLDLSNTGLSGEMGIVCDWILTLNRRCLLRRIGDLPESYLDALDRKLLSIMKLGITNRPHIDERMWQSVAARSIPYARQTIDDDDVYSVVRSLRSDWLTTGPRIAEFEQAVADYVGAKHAVAVSSGTGALHCAMYAIGVGRCHEVVVPAMTFAATANSVVYQGGTPIFCDVDPDSLLMDPAILDAKISKETKAVVSVDYCGQPCDYDRLTEIVKRNGIALIADGCHALGAEYKGRRVGSLADLTVFSFHPVKHIATGEGGMITTDNEALANRMRRFRNHGITRDLQHRDEKRSWFYEMQDLGFNYRLTDIQCALGMSQLEKLPEFLARRREIARAYDESFASTPEITPLGVGKDGIHAYHLYVVRVGSPSSTIDRDAAFSALRECGVGVNVHYIPVHLHPYYRRVYGTGPGLCPVAEKAFDSILSLPMFPAMTDADVRSVAEKFRSVVQSFE